MSAAQSAGPSDKGPEAETEFSATLVSPDRAEWECTLGFDAAGIGAAWPYANRMAERMGGRLLKLEEVE